jgi:serine/threonine protein kinase
MTPASQTLTSEAALGAEEARVLRAVEEHWAAVHAGHKPNRQEFLARHADIAGPLAKCLDGLEFVYTAAPELSGPAAEDVQPSTPLGDYQIVREVGRGGMGVVYEAVQLSLGRRVALKVLPFAAALDHKQLRRFKNEAQAAAHLHHQHIVPVYAVGCERGVHFYAMQFIDGQSLAQTIADCRLQIADRKPSQLGAEPSSKSAICNRQSAMPTVAAALSTQRSSTAAGFFRTVARLGVQAAEALEHAHGQGIVHRDIKPANLLLDDRGNLGVTDFGLAQCQGDARLTLSGDVVGTLRYMSPEQALGGGAVVDQRTDLYSLGVTLYELLTLRPAFVGQDRAELLRQIASEEPCPPGRVNQGLPRDLETVVLKAMAKAPAERYATAQELADDLERFLSDVPVRARRPTPAQRAAKWARRHRTAVTAVVAILALSVVALAVSTLVIWHEQAQTRAAYEAEARAHADEADQRRRAEQNVRLALKVLDDVYLQVAERQFPRDPQREREDRQLLERALAFYEPFVQNNSTDPAVQSRDRQSVPPRGRHSPEAGTR